MSVNDYVARRDAEWMRPVYDLLGVTVAWIDQTSTPDERRRAYQAQVTYAPVSEIGFDVLRDRLAGDAADLVTTQPDVVLIDAADSVMIDEALVPLVLAGFADGGRAHRERAGLPARLRPRPPCEAADDRPTISPLTPAPPPSPPPPRRPPHSP